MGLPIPFAVSLSFIVLYTLQYLFIIRARYLYSDLLVCPRLPDSLPDDIHWNEILRDVRGIGNFRVYIRMNLLWTKYRSEHLSFSCISGASSPGTFPRGVYKVSEYHLSVTDWSELFVIRVRGRISSELIVYPGGNQPEHVIKPSHRNLSERNVAASVLRNQEQFEARPYNAGDDPRRIHWKMLARHEELFVREGSGINRDKKTVLIVLDGGLKMGRSGYRKKKDFMKLDFIIRRLSGILDTLENDGFAVWGVFPGMESYIDFATFSLKDRQNLLASIPPESLKRVPEPGGRSFGLVLFFAPFSPAPGLLEGIERSCRGAVKNMILPAEECARSDRRGWSVVEA